MVTLYDPRMDHSTGSIGHWAFRHFIFMHGTRDGALGFLEIRTDIYPSFVHVGVCFSMRLFVDVASLHLLSRVSFIIAVSRV